MSKLAIGVAVVLALFGTPVLAVDMPVKAPRPPRLVPVLTWSGCYVGGNIGWIGSEDTVKNYPGPNVQFFTPAQAAEATKSITFHNSGLTGGAEAGCNWQVASPLIVGVEADFNGSSVKESANIFYPADLSTGLDARTESNNFSLKWFSTVRGRLGYAADRWFIYATGGLAVARIDTNHTYFDPYLIFGPFSGSDSVTRTGYTIGGGVEYAINNNLSAKIEYLYLNFGTFTFASPATLVNPAVAWATDVRPRENIVRVGLNYKFSN